MKPLHLLPLIGLVCTINSAAQYYSSGTDPLGVRWQIINNNRWSLFSDTAAARWATIADRILTQKAPLLNADYPSTDINRLKVVIHSRHAFSNGLVGWAPSRLEAYAYDFGQDDCIPWTTHLMTHEFRHVLQMQTLNNGFGKFLYVLFGEQSTGLFAGLSLPKWFLEGDAVMAETNYTDGGRGRNADFTQQMRALALDDALPSYEQAYFGSYKFRFPDYYHMGYYTINEVAQKHGNLLWGKVLRKTSRYPWLLLPPFFGGLVPFNRYLRQETGMRRVDAYYWAMKQNAERWKGLNAQNSFPESHKLFDPNKEMKLDYVEATHVQPWRDGWVSYMESPSFVSHFAVTDANGKTKRLLIPSMRNEAAFSVHGDTIVWAERKSHPRWTLASTDRLMVANIQTGKTRTLSCESSFHSPAISPDGKRIAVVSIDRDMQHRLETLDWDGNRQHLTTFPLPNMLTDLTWTDDNTIVGVMVSDEGKSLIAYHIDSHKLITLIPPKFANLRNPSANSKTIFFTSDEDGKNNIYAYDIATGNVYRQTNARIGADYPQTTSRGLIASEYSKDGYTPVTIENNADNAIATYTPTPTALPQATATAPSHRTGIGRIHLVPNIHSWGLIDVNTESYDLKPALNVVSQNVHGTVIWDAGINFGKDTEHKRYYASVTWDWLYPKLTFSGTWGQRSYQQTSSQQTMGESWDITINRQATLDDVSKITKLEGSISIPLTHNTGPWMRGIMPYYSFDYEKHTGVTWDISESTYRSSRRGAILIGEQHKTETTPTDRYFCMTTGLNLYMLGRTAQRDIDYRKGFTLKTIYDWTPVGTDYGQMFSTMLTAYAPGFARHHSISLSMGWQKKWFGEGYSTSLGETSYHILSERISSPYGTSLQKNTEALLLRATYALPLLNPDWVLGPLFYIKRIGLKAFYDYGQVKAFDGLEVYSPKGISSFGAELWAETYPLRLPFPLKIGTRASKVDNLNSLQWDLLFSVSFN